MSVISDAERVGLGRLITRLQNDGEGSGEALVVKGTDVDSGRAHVVGVSGIAGAGKSTLISQLIPILRRNSLRIVVLAIDPTSEKNQGALLGDRIRMRDSYSDQGVFIRSLGTRGAPDALTVALPSIIRASATVCDMVLVETAGAGQVDVGIHRLVDTFVTLFAPLGDMITLMKAGQAEHAHVIAVNTRKGLSENERFVDQARVLLGRESVQDGWNRKVFALDAKHGEGIEALVDDGLLAHREFLK